MTPFAVALDARPVHRTFRLSRPGTPTAVASPVRPAVVLGAAEARALLVAAEREDVSHSGCCLAGPAGVQVWSGPWNGVAGSRGSAVLLGSVAWTRDAPARHCLTVHRVLVTAAGTERGTTLTGLLDRVLGLAGVEPRAGTPLATAVASPASLGDRLRVRSRRAVLVPSRRSA